MHKDGKETATEMYVCPAVLLEYGYIQAVKVMEKVVARFADKSRSDEKSCTCQG